MPTVITIQFGSIKRRMDDPYQLKPIPAAQTQLNNARTSKIQGPRHTKDVIKRVPVDLLFSTEHSKGKMLALSQELRSENNCNGYNLG